MGVWEWFGIVGFVDKVEACCNCIPHGDRTRSYHTTGRRPLDIMRGFSSRQ